MSPPPTARALTETAHRNSRQQANQRSHSPPRLQRADATAATIPKSNDATALKGEDPLTPNGEKRYKLVLYGPLHPTQTQNTHTHTHKPQWSVCKAGTLLARWPSAHPELDCFALCHQENACQVNAAHTLPNRYGWKTRDAHGVQPRIELGWRVPLHTQRHPPLARTQTSYGPQPYQTRTAGNYAFASVRTKHLM